MDKKQKKDEEKIPSFDELIKENIKELTEGIDALKLGKDGKEFTKEQQKIINIFAMFRVFSTMKMLKEDNIPIELINGLFIGTVGAAMNYKILKEKGITHIICAAMNIKEYFPKQFKYLTVKLLDSETENIKKYFDQTGKFIDDAFKEKGKVLVHCHAGISRSSTICLAYIIKYKKMSFDKALELVKKKRDKINPNPGFIIQLREYQKDNGIKN